MSSTLHTYEVTFKIGVLPFKVTVVAHSREEADQKVIEKYEVMPDYVEQVS